MVLFKIILKDGLAPWVTTGDIVTPTSQQLHSLPTVDLIRVKPVFTVRPWKQKAVIVKAYRLEQIEDAADDTV